MKLEELSEERKGLIGGAHGGGGGQGGDEGADPQNEVKDGYASLPFRLWVQYNSLGGGRDGGFVLAGVGLGDVDGRFAAGLAGIHERECGIYRNCGN